MNLIRIMAFVQIKTANIQKFDLKKSKSWGESQASETLVMVVCGDAALVNHQELLTYYCKYPIINHKSRYSLGNLVNT